MFKVRSQQCWGEGMQHQGLNLGLLQAKHVLSSAPQLLSLQTLVPLGRKPSPLLFLKK